MSSGEPSPSSRWMRWAMVGVGVMAVVIVGVLVWPGQSNPGAGADPSDPATPAATAVPSPSVPVPTATGSASVVSPKPEVTQTVRVKDRTEPEPGIVARVVRIQPVKGTAQGPGEVAGPALRVALELSNNSSSKISLDAVVVNLYYGSKSSPASPLSGPGAKPFSGTVGPGSKATGTYVFNVPTDQRKQIKIEFRYSAEAPVTVFEGSA